MALHTPLTRTDHCAQKIFDAIYSRVLVCNTSREDPAVDRLALNLRANDRPAAELQQLDRVRTYAGFRIADLSV